MPEWISILPPILAIVVAVWKKEVVLALGLGIWLAEAFLVADSTAWQAPEQWFFWPLALLELAYLGFIGMLERVVAVFADGGNTRVLLFGLIVGALLELMQRSGGVAAFVKKLVNAGLTNSRRKVGALPSLIGMTIFVETSLSVLSAGVVARDLFDKLRMSRARLAFLVDSTCAPVSVLVLINGWGAYILGLLDGYGLESPVMTMAGSIGYNFYAILVLMLVWYTVLSTRVHGPMVESEAAAAKVEEVLETEKPTKARYMLIPLFLMVVGVIFFMFYTGDGDFRQGSGSRSVLWSVTLATVVAMAMLAWDKIFAYRRMVELSYVGVAKLAPVVTIMLLSFAIGASCRALGTGPFVAGLVGEFLPAFMVAPLLFVSAGVIAFTTGTSWGTFAIMIPVGIPLGAAMGIPPSLLLAAILGGGVFGDHCSPISDTTIISSLASGCDHLEHVRTQLPYAVTAGIGTILLYLVLGIFVM